MELADSLRSQLVLSMAIHALIDGLTSLAFLFPFRCDLRNGDGLGHPDVNNHLD